MADMYDAKKTVIEAGLDVSASITEKRSYFGRLKPYENSRLVDDPELYALLPQGLLEKSGTAYVTAVQSFTQDRGDYAGDVVVELPVGEGRGVLMRLTSMGYGDTPAGALHAAAKLLAESVMNEMVPLAQNLKEPDNGRE